VAGGCIPFTRAPQAGIDIGLALRHETELQRRASRDRRGHAAVGREPLEGVGVAVGATRDDRCALRRNGSHRDLPPPVLVYDKRALTRSGGKEPAFGGSQDNPQHGYSLLDAGDIDRKFPIPAQKLLGAVEWVHEPEGAGRRVAAGARVLLSDDRKLAGELGDDELL